MLPEWRWGPAILLLFQPTARVESHDQSPASEVRRELLAGWLFEEDLNRRQRARAEILLRLDAIDVCVFHDQIRLRGHHRRIGVEFVQHVLHGVVAIQDHKRLVAGHQLLNLAGYLLIR